jgi:hypothetical protein
MRGTYSEKYEGLQIKIESKRLQSGKCQVKFSTKGMFRDDYYGYTLVDGEKTLREVIAEIKAKLRKTGGPNNYYQRNLYSLQRRSDVENDFVIFKTANQPC